MPIDTADSDTVCGNDEPGPRQSGGGCGRIVGRRWFVVQTEPNAEFLARNEIKQISDKTGVVPFLPLDRPRKVIRTNRIGRIVSRRTFPVVLMYRYLFVNFDVNEPGWQRIYSCPGVKRILGMTATRPAPIDAGFIEHLLTAASKEGVVPDAAQTMIRLGATLELLGHGWKSGRYGQVHENPRVFVRVDFHGFSWDAWFPGQLFAGIRAVTE